jgi:hypothetical protein
MSQHDIAVYEASWPRDPKVQHKMSTAGVFLDTENVNLTLFADNTCLYATERKEGYGLRKLQRGLNSTVAWCERWNIKTNEDKTRAIYFSHRSRQPWSLLTLNGRAIPFVNNKISLYTLR